MDTSPSVFDETVEIWLGQAMDRYSSDDDIDRQIDFLVGRTAQLLKQRVDRDGQLDERRRGCIAENIAAHTGRRSRFMSADVVVMLVRGEDANDRSISRRVLIQSSL